MPVDSEVVLNIVCDNPSCPGNSLDPADRTGWYFVSAEIYGEPSAQFVYCSADCTSAVGQGLVGKDAAPAPI